MLELVKFCNVHSGVVIAVVSGDSDCNGNGGSGGIAEGINDKLLRCDRM